MEEEKLKKIIEGVKELADTYSTGIPESAKGALETIKDIVGITLEEE